MYIVYFLVSHYSCLVKVERGTAVKGAEVEIIGLGGHLKSTLTGIGKFIGQLYSVVLS